MVRVFLGIAYRLLIIGIEIDLPENLLERLFLSDYCFVVKLVGKKWF